MISDKHRLPASLLAPQVDPGRLGFDDTSEVKPLDDTIGQERAVEALDFGLRMHSPGFNIFISGPVGTGKGTLVRQMVKRLAQTAPAPSDWCYVHNFQDASRPTCLSFPAGQGGAFKREMSTFIEGLRRDIPAAFEGKKYLDARAKIIEETEGKKKALFHDLTALCHQRGFGFEETPVGFGLVPLKNDRPSRPWKRGSLPCMAQTTSNRHLSCSSACPPGNADRKEPFRLRAYTVEPPRAWRRWRSLSRIGEKAKKSLRRSRGKPSRYVCLCTITPAWTAEKNR